MAEGTSKIAIVCVELEDGYEFTYTPTAPGDYLFNIKYCNVNLAGSPFKAVITGTIDRHYIGTENRMSFHTHASQESAMALTNNLRVFDRFDVCILQN